MITLRNSSLRSLLLKIYLIVENGQKGNSLYGLAESHLVGQDGVGALTPGETQPVEAFQLIGVKFAPCLLYTWWLAL